MVHDRLGLDRACDRPSGDCHCLHDRSVLAVIELKHCAIEFTEYGVVTKLQDGSECPAWPHWKDPHYTVISHRCGYRDDLLSYCREHEFVHSFLAEKLTGEVSTVVWNSAHDLPFPQDALYEEALVQTFQRWLRANEEPIMAGADWGQLKEESLWWLRKG